MEGHAVASVASAKYGALKRSLGLKDLLFFGIATIMGSGGFNFIGEGVKQGGPLFPVAIAIVAALLFAASKVYSDAYEMFKTNTSESDVVRQEFGDFGGAFTAVAILAFNVFSSSTLLVLAAKSIFPAAPWSGQIGFALSLLGSAAAFSLKGIDANKEFVATFSGLIIALLAGASAIGIWEGFDPAGTGLLAFPAALSRTPSFVGSIVFFYFVLAGFDDLMKFAEEATEPDKNVPASFFLSNAVSTALTIGVAYAFVHVLTIPKMGLGPGATTNPLGAIFQSVLGSGAVKPLFWIGIGLMLTSGFVDFLVVTRYLFGLAELPPGPKDALAGSHYLSRFKWLRELNGAQVPWKAVLAAVALIGGGIVINNVDTLVRISDLSLTLVLLTVTGAVGVAKWRRDGRPPWLEGATGLGFLGLLYASCCPA
jgi:amino acid transporter